MNANMTTTSLILVPFLDEDERPRANSLHGSPIVETNCMTNEKRIGYGKLKKVEGLLFDTSLPNFNPLTWKYPITKDISCMNLELCSEGFNGIDNCVTYSLHIHRHVNHDISMLLKTCQSIANNYSGVRCKGWGGVGGMYSAGYNVGYKGRIAPVAMSPKMKKMAKPDVHAINNSMFMAGKKFKNEFIGANVGFKEMMQMQSEMWPKNRQCPKGPACWIVSKDLGNPQHDDNDYSRSYAGWFTEQDIENRSAWFLFPKWGIAIELCNNTWISWDGAHCSHCSSVPHLTTENHIYSLFTAIPKKVYLTAKRVNKCEEILKSSPIEFSSLRLRDKVCLRWVEPFVGNNLGLNKRTKRKYGNEHRRWLQCVIVDINCDGGGVLLQERYKNKRKLPPLSKQEVKNRMVLGWH